MAALPNTLKNNTIANSITLHYNTHDINNTFFIHVA